MLIPIEQAKQGLSSLPAGNLRNRKPDADEEARQSLGIVHRVTASSLAARSGQWPTNPPCGERSFPSLDRRRMDTRGGMAIHPACRFLVQRRFLRGAGKSGVSDRWRF